MDRSATNLDLICFTASKLEDPAMRSSYLDEACGEDADLRGRVERWLASEPLVSRFLESPAVAPASIEAPAALEPGSVIGRYKLVEEIGEGGMGTVYMAEQAEPLRRRVALKVIKAGMDSRLVVARFETERQALALMDHPNIARVFDGGVTPSGRPYFVMELVHGLPITEYCDQHQLPIRERLELFVLVCRAVQHAHQKGVIHRDLKPSNVLVTVVDDAAVPKIIDFGIAKATGQALTDRTVFTGFHQFLGTPLYTSPEQMDLSGVDVDTRSDIYSLGVLLYELLTGTTPFDSETIKRAAFDEMRRILREEEPPRPSTRLGSMGEAISAVSDRRKADPRRLGASMRGELDWVAMKALEKDRRRRYETAHDFAADVMRYLTDRPVGACPPSAWYRFAKYARRNRAALSTAILVGLALIVGGVVSIGQAIRAKEAEARASSRAAEALQVTGFLTDDVFGAAAPGGGYDRSMTVGELFDRADAAIGPRFENQPLVEASVRLALGKSYVKIGDGKRAIPHVARAVELRYRILGAEHPLTLQAMREQVEVLGYASQYATCEPIARRLLAGHIRHLGPDDAETIWDRHTLAYMLWKGGKSDEALVYAEQAEARAVRHLGPLHYHTLYAWDILGQIVADRGDRVRGAALLRRSIAGREETIGPLDQSVLWCMQNLARILEADGRLDEARQVLTDLVGRNAQVYGLSHINSSAAMSFLMNVLRAQGDHAAFRDIRQGWIRQMLAVPREREPFLRHRRSITLAKHAMALALESDAAPFDGDLAVQAAEEAVNLHDDWDDAWTCLAVVYYRLGRLDDAMRAIQSSIARPRWKGGDDFDWLVLALIHARRGELDHARVWYEKARSRKDPVDFNRVDLRRLRDEAEDLLDRDTPGNMQLFFGGRKSTRSCRSRSHQRLRSTC